MSRSSGRGQVDPLAALVAVAAVGIGLSLYAGSASDVLREPSGKRAPQVLDAIHDEIAPDGVVSPTRLTEAVEDRGVQVNATLRTRNSQWSAGPTPPETATDARRRVSVGLSPTRVRPGRLRVVVW